MKRLSYQKLITILLFCGLSLPTNTVVAQAKQTSFDGFSINAGIGGYGAYEPDVFFCEILEISLRSKGTIFSGEYYRADEFWLFGPNPAEYVNYAGILVGKYTGDRFFGFNIKPDWVRSGE